MKTNSLLRIIVCSMLLATSFQSAFAQLPSRDTQPWLGFFAAHSNNRFQFGITSNGEMQLTPMGPKAPVGFRIVIKIEANILETLPDGKIVTKRLIAESLETTDTTTDKLEKAVFRGKVTGDSSFEVTVEQSRGFILIGGRLLDPGSAKNPLRFVISAKIPDLYADSKKDKEDDKKLDEREQKKRDKEFSKKLKDDNLSLKWTDGKELKYNLADTMDLNSADVNGPGIAELELEALAYQNREVQFTASPNSSMTLSRVTPSPLHKGFTIQWAPDPAKDPDGKARLAVSVR